MNHKFKNILLAFMLVMAMIVSGIPLAFTSYAEETAEQTVTDDSQNGEQIGSEQESSEQTVAEPLEDEAEQSDESLQKPRGGEKLRGESTTGTSGVSVVVNGLKESEAQPVSVDKANPSAGDTVTVTANAVSGYYLAQVRIGYEDNGEAVYQNLNVEGTQASFEMPETD